MERVNELVDVFVDEMGGDRYAVVLFLGILAMMGISFVAFIYLSWSWITAVICVFIGFLTVSLSVLV